MNTKEHLIIDLQKLYEFSGNSKSTVNSIIQVFLDEAPKQIENLAALMAEKKWSSVKALSHNMKSSYAVLGANAVRTLLETMEMKCEQTSVDEKELNTLFNAVLKLNEEVIQHIRTSASQYGE